MAGKETPKTQPSDVSTADTPPERPQNVFTEEPEIAAARKDSKAAPTDPPDGQKSDDSATPPDKAKPKPKRNRPAERRISKLNRKLEQEREEKEALANQVAELNERLSKVESAASAKPEPQLKDFENPQEYAKAYAKWDKEQAAATETTKPKAEPKPKADPKPPAASGPHAADDLVAFAQDGSERLGEDFETAFKDKDLAVNQAMGEFLLNSDVGPELYVHLHKNPTLAKSIYLEGPEDAQERLAELEEQIAEGETPEPEPKPEPKQKEKASTKSKAPKPPSPPDRGEVLPEKNLETADMDDYAATRRKQLKEAGHRY